MPFRISQLAKTLACFLVILHTTAFAADEAFVGVLALAVDEEIADQIGLSPDVRSQLEELIDERESEALEMALSMRELPPQEQAAKLKQFRLESEQRGLKLLDDDAQSALESIRIRQTGMSSLAERAVVERLKLTDEQQSQVATILAAREQALAQAGGAKAMAVRSNFDRQLKAVLTPDQLVAWTSMTTPKDLPPSTRLKGSRPNQVDATKVSMRSQTGTGSETLKFSFKYAPWQNVIEWFAEQCELSLLMDSPPQGTFNYTDPREYSRAQAIDLLNSVLLTKGYTLIRREKMLQVVNLEDGIPPNFITEVSEDELDDLGEYELVRCLFTLQSVNAEDAREEIDRLLGPQGTVNVLTSSNQLAITETAGRLRTFRRILQQGERQNASALGQAKLLRLQHVRASKIIAAWRKLMGLTDEDNATLDGSLRVTPGKTSLELLVSGKPNRVQEFEDLVSLLDVASGLGPREVPQLEVYSITEADPESVLNVIETLLEGTDDVRLATDPKTGSLIALARPDQHETIQATIRQLQTDRRKVEVIRLRQIDPQLAMLSIEKLFGAPPGEEEGSNTRNVPIVDADPVTRSLMIRGSESQIEDIRTLLLKMGEDESTTGNRSGFGGDGGKLRMIPIDSGTARRTMDQLNAIWPTVRGNRIRTVSPSTQIRGIRTNRRTRSDNELKRDLPAGSQDKLESTDNSMSRMTHFVSDEHEVVSPEDNADQLSEILVTIGEQGLMIASEDTQALDEFEELFRTLSDRLFAGSRQLTIFYLRYAKAEVAGEFVKQFVGLSSGSSSGGGTLLGNIAGAALGGGGGGGIIGSLLGGGGGSSASVSLSKGTSVIADPRLNALVVQATPKELDFIEELLQVLDRADSPEVIETVPRPRAIPVIHADAEDVAEVVRSVYATRLAGGDAGRSRQPSPEDFLKIMTGQKNTGKEIAAAIGEQVGITISVDSRRNALIVIAPQSLFDEIQDLVADLDYATPGREETIRYGSVAGSSPEIIRSAIESLISEEQESKGVANKPRQKQTAKQIETGANGQGLEELKRRMEFFKAIQKATGQQKAATKKAANKKTLEFQK